MTLTCTWCNSIANHGNDTVYWELPDGTRAIEITDTPAIICANCGITYTDDVVTKEIEDQLFLVDTKRIAKSIGYQDLMALPRLLKRNYFDLGYE